MQKSCDHAINEPMFLRTSTSELRRSSAARYSASSVKEVVVPLDSNIKYRKYKFPKNPTVLDYVLAVPRNISFYFNNLSRAFGVKFVLLVCIVYGLQQGMGNAWFYQARDYYFKDELDLEPADAQAYIAASQTPWNIKPMYGIVSDTMAFFGLHRAPYIALAGGVGGVGLALLATSPLAVLLAVVFLFGVNFSVSSPDVMIDATIAEKCKYYPKFASDLQALCWGAMSLSSVVGYATSGLLIQYLGSRPTFGILIATSACVFLGGAFNWLGEKPDVDQEDLKENKPPCLSFNFAQYEEHKRLFRLAIFISACACCISIIVLLTKDWMIRFTAILAIASSVAAAVYLVNRKTLPDVANVALFIFLQQSLTPDIETTMFYWYTDAENGPKFDPVFVGIISMIGYMTMFLGIAIFNKYLTTWQYRKIFVCTQLLMVGTNMLDLVIVTRKNIEVGIPDKAMIFGDATLSPMVRRFIMMPIYVLAAKVCPDGAEATLFAMLMALSNFGSTISVYFGSFIVLLFNVSDDNFDNLKWVIVVKSLCRLLPIPLTFMLVPDGCPQDDDDDEGGARASTASVDLYAKLALDDEDDEDDKDRLNQTSHGSDTMKSPLIFSHVEHHAPGGAVLKADPAVFESKL